MLSNIQKNQLLVTGLGLNVFRFRVLCLKVAGSIIQTLSVLALTMVSTAVSAAENPEDKPATYFGADIVYNNLSLEAADATFNPVTGRVRLGVNIFPDLIPSLGFESHFTFDIADDEQVVNGQNITMKLDHQFALFARPYFEMSDSVMAYGLIGFAAVQLQGDTVVVPDDTETSISIGAGAEFALPFDINGRIEALQLVTGDEFDLFTLSFGISISL